MMLILPLLTVLCAAGFCHSKAFREESPKHRSKRAYDYGQSAVHLNKDEMYYYPEVDGQPIMIPPVDSSPSTYNELLDQYFKKFSYQTHSTRIPNNLNGVDHVDPMNYKTAMKNVDETDVDHYSNIHEHSSNKKSYSKYSDPDAKQSSDYDTPEVVDKINIKKKGEPSVSDYEQPIIRETVKAIVPKPKQKKKKLKTTSTPEYGNTKDTQITQKKSKGKRRKQSQIVKKQGMTEYETSTVKFYQTTEDGNYPQKPTTIVKTKNKPPVKEKVVVKTQQKEPPVKTKEKVVVKTQSKQPSVGEKVQIDSKDEYEDTENVVVKTQSKEPPVKTKEKVVVKTKPKEPPAKEKVPIETNEDDYEDSGKVVVKKEPKEPPIKEKVVVKTQSKESPVKTKEKVVVKTPVKENVHIKPNEDDYEDSGKVVVKTKPKEPPVKEKVIVKTQPKESPVKTKEKVVVKTQQKEPPVKEKVHIKPNEDDYEDSGKVVVKTKPKEPPVKEKVIVKTQPKESPVKTKEKVVVKTQQKEPPVKEKVHIKTNVDEYGDSEKVVKTKPKEPSVKEKVVIKTQPKESPVKTKEKVVVKTQQKEPPVKVKEHIKPDEYEDSAKVVIKTQPKESPVKTKEKVVVKTQQKEPPVKVKEHIKPDEYEDSEKVVVETKPKEPPIKEKVVIKTQTKKPPVKTKEKVVVKTQQKEPPAKVKEHIKPNEDEYEDSEKVVVETKPKEPPIKEKVVIKTQTKKPPVKTKEKVVVKTHQKDPPVKEKVVVKTQQKDPPVKEKVVVKTQQKDHPVKEKVVVKTQQKDPPVKTKEKVVVKTQSKKPPVTDKAEIHTNTEEYETPKVIEKRKFTEDTDSLLEESKILEGLEDLNEDQVLETDKRDEVKNEPLNANNFNPQNSDFGSSEISTVIRNQDSTNTPKFLPNIEAVQKLASLNSNIWSLIFNPNAERLKLQKCITRNNETGFCTYIQHCEVPGIATSLEQLLNNACVIDDVFIGVCCPEFPVESVKVHWEQNPSDSNARIEDEFGHDTQGELIKSWCDGYQQSLTNLLISFSLADCGIRSDEASKLQTWPWKAPLVSVSNGKIFCGGVIINDEYVLTAAHCTTKIPRNQILVRLGQFNDMTGDDFAVVEIKRHAQYNPRTLHNDIALLKLGRRISRGTHVGVVCLPDNEDKDDDGDEDEHDGEKALLLGWKGIFGTKSRDPEGLRVMSNEECQKQLGQKIPASFLCTEARDENERSCNADSGAPLVIEDDGKYEVIGILSWNRNDCDQRFPSTFSRVSSYIGWIQKHAV